MEAIWCPLCKKIIIIEAIYRNYDSAPNNSCMFQFTAPCGLKTEVGVAQNNSQVAQIAQVAQLRSMPVLRNLRCALFAQFAQFALHTMPFFPLLRNLRCALCLFFQRLRNLRLRIVKSNICCALIVNFFPRCAITK